MRQIAEALSIAQARPTVRPAIYIQVGDYAFRIGDTAHGGSSSCHNTNADSPSWTKDRYGRILKVKVTESPWKHDGEVTLSNFDGFLNDADLMGQRIYISWGAMTDEGPLYSTAPVMRVTAVETSSSEGVLVKMLRCSGPADLMGKDNAQSTYTADGLLKVGELVVDVFDSTMTCFTSAKPYHIVYDNSADAIWSSLVPGLSFKVSKGQSRTYTLARLFDLTEVVWRPGSEQPDSNGYDTIHLLLPNKSTYDFEFSLDLNDHRFYAVADSDNLVIPNEFIISSPSGSATTYTGRARHARSYSRYPTTRTEYMSGIDSNLLAAQVAKAMLDSVVAYSRTSQIAVPMVCNAEIYDRIKVTDKRSGNEYSGNIGTLTRTFDANKAQYDMTCAFGKWYDPRSLSDYLGLGVGFIDTEETVVQSGGSAQFMQWAAGVFATTGTSLAGYIIFDAVDEYASYKISLSPGVYSLGTMWEGVKNSAIKVYLDDAEIGTVTAPSNDGWSYETITGITISGGLQTIKLVASDLAASNINLMLLSMWWTSSS